MGNAASSVENEEIRVLMVGLEGAGKTTILHTLIPGETVTTTPYAGFTVETAKYKNISFTVWDVVSDYTIRPLWGQYFPDIQALIFVVDSNDEGRMREARNELKEMLNEFELRNAALLIFANKQDLPTAMHSSAIINELGLHEITNRKWYMQSASATNFNGLLEGIDWLSKQVNNVESN